MNTPVHTATVQSGGETQISVLTPGASLKPSKCTALQQHVSFPQRNVNTVSLEKMKILTFLEQEQCPQSCDKWTTSGTRRPTRGSVKIFSKLPKKPKFDFPCIFSQLHDAVTKSLC